MKINFTKMMSRMLLAAFLLMMILLFAGCASKNKKHFKKTETVSEIVQNDIQKKEVEKIEVAEIIKTDAISWSVVPVDNQKPSKVIINGTPVDLINAKVEYNSSTKEENKNTLLDRTTASKDLSKTAAAISVEEESSSKEKKGTSPTLIWSLLILLLVVGVVLYIKKKIPFL